MQQVAAHDTRHHYQDHRRIDVIRRITIRLIPFLGFIYLIAYIDRENVSYAKLQMVGDLGLSESTA